MYAVEKKIEIELKLKKEISNIEELKAAANRSSMLAKDVCNVLGACEQRLQQLETAVLPLYGDTARLQQIHRNMEGTVKALDNVINYYMVSRELADSITAGPLTSSPESLNDYLEALDKLAEAQKYFNINNQNSVELENINTLYNTGVSKLETSFEDLLSRNTRPLSPSTLMDMIAIEEDSSAESVSVGSVSGASIDSMRAAAGWLSAAGRPPVQPLLAIRGPAALSSLNAFRDYLRTRSMSSSPLMRSKNILHRSDSSAKKTSKIQKVLEKRANKIMMKASQTLEQSTGFAIGPRKSMSDSYTEECSGELNDEEDTEAIGTLAVCLTRLARNEQRYLLGLVPLQKLPALLIGILKQCFAVLAADIERAGARWKKAASKCSPSSAVCWSLLSRLQRLQPDIERALGVATQGHNSANTYSAILHSCQAHCIRTLEEWSSSVRTDGSAVPADGTVHRLSAAALAVLHASADHMPALGPALASEPWYARAVNEISVGHDRDAAMLALYMRKVLAQLNLTLRSKSEQYPDALKAIFRLNNTLYLLQGLQRTSLIDILMIAEPECESNYTDLIQEYKTAYLQSWNKLLAHTELGEDIDVHKLRDKDRQIIKDKFASFNRELEECTKAQRGYSVPDAELRESLKRDNKETILPPYSRLYDTYAALPFTKNRDKYVKYNPVQVATQLDGYFDESA